MAVSFDRSLDAPYGAAVRLSPLVARLLAPNPGPFTFKGTGVYIVGGGRDVAVIDPGPDDPAHLEALKRALAGRKVSHILVTHTHRDHSPAAAALKAWSGAPTFGYSPHVTLGGDVEAGADRSFVPDVVVRDGTRIAGADFTLECVFTPGHTANHTCYALAEEGALFTGDHVMGWSTSVVAPPDGDMGDYLASLEKLIARGDRILYPTHGSPVTAPRDLLRAFLLHRRMREAQIVSAVKDGIGNSAALTAKLYPGLDPALVKAARLTVEAHLQLLLRQGRILRAADGRYTAASG
jgi:glyoxylase-like metal-dependent hydrolase (beta-lactamase superfamily II)